MASHEDLKTQFKNICGVDDERAQFFLEAAGWDISIAVREFFSATDNNSNADAELDLPPSGPSRAPRRPPEPSSRFASLANFRAQEESDEEEEEGEAFYVGGSEKGAGQQVLGPPKKKASEIAQQMFASALEHGATPVDHEAAPAVGSSTRSSAFTGIGYKLGDDPSAPSEVVAGRAVPARRPARVDRVLKLWRDGFSVDDGPLRSYSDQEQREFLASVRRGEIPDELLRDAKGGEVNLNMEDHRDEEFVPPPKPKVVSFAGKGYVLGSPAPNVAEESSAPTIVERPSAVTVDSSLPTAQIHVRLEDGSRLSLSMNLNHTIADIRQQIMSERPQYAGHIFTLQTNFPKRELTDLSQTIENANLKNSCILMRSQRG